MSNSKRKNKDDETLSPYVKQRIEEMESPDHVQAMIDAGAAFESLEAARERLKRRVRTLETASSTGRVEEVEKAEQAVEEAQQAVEDAENHISWMRGDVLDAPEPTAGSPSSSRRTGYSTKPARQAGKESAEQRQARRYKMCIDAGLEMPTKDAQYMPRGIKHVAEQEGVRRQTFVQDVWKHIDKMNRER